jgi:hypothetical protein
VHAETRSCNAPRDAYSLWLNLLIRLILTINKQIARYLYAPSPSRTDASSFAENGPHAFFCLKRNDVAESAMRRLCFALARAASN